MEDLPAEVLKITKEKELLPDRVEVAVAADGEAGPRGVAPEVPGVAGPPADGVAAVPAHV